MASQFCLSFIVELAWSTLSCRLQVVGMSFSKLLKIYPFHLSCRFSASVLSQFGVYLYQSLVIRLFSVVSKEISLILQLRACLLCLLFELLLLPRAELIGSGETSDSGSRLLKRGNTYLETRTTL